MDSGKRKIENQHKTRVNIKCTLDWEKTMAMNPEHRSAIYQILERGKIIFLFILFEIRNVSIKTLLCKCIIRAFNECGRCSLFSHLYILLDIDTVNNCFI